MAIVCWRIQPPPGVHARVRATAAEEGRSVSNLLVRLVAEALDQRAREAALRGEKDAFIEKIRTQMGSVCD
jgi:hypothetical protein